jgi:hypothetical protein
MLRNLLPIALLMALVVAAPAARAQDRIKLKSDPTKPVAGNIEKESPAGIRIAAKGASQMIPAGEILDVIYDVKGEVKVAFYVPAMNSETKIDAPTTRDRKKAILKAINDFEEVARMARSKKTRPKHDLLERHAEFKIAMLEARRAQEAGTAPTTAIKRLQEFKNKYADGWQITAAATLLAELLVEDKDYNEADKVFQDLAGLPDLPAEARGQFQFLAAQVSMRPGKYADAETKLQKLVDKLPKDSPIRLRAQIAQAVCQAEIRLAKLKKDADVKDKAEAVAAAGAQINRLLDENKTDKELHALGYNALGQCDYAAELFKDALWSFLRVDVVYNQNREEHAKALYYLADLFDKLKDKDHAEECRARLGSKAFAGTDYQRRLLKGGVKTDEG